MPQFLRFTVIVCALLSLSASFLRGEVLSSNLSSASAGSESATSSTWLAASFKATADATLNSVVIPLAASSGGLATVRIYSDSGQKPGAALGALLSPASYATSLTQTTFTGSVALTANNTYWVVLQPVSGTFSWSWTTSTTGDGAGYTNTWSFSPNGGSSWYSLGIYALQMAVNINTPTTGCTYALTPTAAQAPALGGFGMVSITTGTSCPWAAGSNSSWISISWGDTGTGPGVVLYNTEANLTNAARSGSLTIAGQTVNITQGTSDPSITSVFRDGGGAMRSNRLGSPTITNGGGVFGGDPATAQDNAGNTYVAARDTYGSLWANVLYADQTWGTWKLLGGSVQGRPAIAISTSGTAYILARDSWNAYWMTTYTPGGNTASWTYLAGIFSTDPAIAASPDGSLYFVGKDFYSGLWASRYDNSYGFSGWVFGGGIVSGTPSITVGTDSIAYVAARDTWGAAWMNRLSPAGWLGWSSGGGVLARDPQVVSLSNGSVAVVGSDLGGSIYTATYTQGVWGSWNNTGGVLASFGAGGLNGELFVFGRSSQGSLWWYRSSTAGWGSVSDTTIAAGEPSVSPR